MGYILPPCRFDPRWEALDAEIASIREQQTEIAAQADRILEVHDDEFKV